MPSLRRSHAALTGLTGDEKIRLGKVRDQLLEMTQEMDKAAQAQMAEATNLLRELMEAPDLNQAMQDNLPRIDDAFLAVLNLNIEAAQKAKRSDALTRLVLDQRCHQPDDARVRAA